MFDSAVSGPLQPHISLKLSFDSDSPNLICNLLVSLVPQLSGRGLKRFLRWERDRAARPERRRVERQNRRDRKRQRKAELGENSENSSNLPQSAGLKGKNRRLWVSEYLSKIPPQPRIAVDFSFFSSMVQAEQSSLAKQVRHLYGQIVRAPFPIEMILTSFDDSVRSLMSKNAGLAKWAVKFEEKKFEEIFEKEKIVYLTAESETLIEKFDPTDIYIIGGLVDRNRLKGVAYEKARALGLRTARLPISEFLANSKNLRTVITVNQVGEIILQYWQNLSARVSAGLSVEFQPGTKFQPENSSTVDWGEILTKILPARSQWKTKEKNETETNNQENLSNESEGESDSEESQLSKD